MKKAAPKKDKVRKVLVRNSIIPARPCDVKKEKRVQFTEEKEKEEAIGIEPKDFSVPEFCSILKLADEIKKVQLKPNCELKKREADKISKQCNVNFEPDEKLYQDLINIDKPTFDSKPKQKSSSCLKYVTKRDPEPDLKELLKYDLQPEYKSTTLIYPEVKRPLPEYDGHSIYRLHRRLTVRNTY